MKLQYIRETKAKLLYTKQGSFKLDDDNCFEASDVVGKQLIKDKTRYSAIGGTTPTKTTAVETPKAQSVPTQVTRTKIPKGQ